MIIGVDVDLTVVNSDFGLFDWCNDYYMDGPLLERKDGEMYSYSLSPEFPDQDPHEILAYWRQEDLYDDLDPIEGSVNCLRALSELGHKIVFVSALKGNHHKSKYQFLERNFPFMDGFIGTKEKHFARVGMLIDDRVSNLNNVWQWGIIPVQYASQYKQDVEPVIRMPSIKDWSKDSLNTILDLIKR